MCWRSARRLSESEISQKNRDLFLPDSVISEAQIIGRILKGDEQRGQCRSRFATGEDGGDGTFLQIKEEKLCIITVKFFSLSLCVCVCVCVSPGSVRWLLASRG